MPAAGNVAVVRQFGEGVLDYTEVVGTALPASERLALFKCAQVLVLTAVREVQYAYDLREMQYAYDLREVQHVSDRKNWRPSTASNFFYWVRHHCPMSHLLITDYRLHGTACVGRLYLL